MNIPVLVIITVLSFAMINSLAIKQRNNKKYFDTDNKGTFEWKKIFTIFHRIDKEDSYTHSNGLGLSICKGIVAAHNGKILATSNGLNKGSCFRVIMPLRDKRVVVINDWC